jgi:protein-S-isoprenylcysteine O-methyltransferase Ste14
MNTKLVLLYFLDQILSVFGMGVALFWSAGRIDWWPAWAAIAVWLVSFTAMDIVMLHLNPGLLAERLAPPKGAKTWDRTILSILRLLQLARYILAGLDQRYGWTGGFPLAAQIFALMVCVLGYTLLVRAMASNDFFSQVVRIQSERGHTVVTGGLYRYVRHPAYVGMILFELAMSTLLASWWAIIAGGLCAILLILRTVLEDRTLQAELAGYSDYARQVRYRLLPGIW